MGVILLAPLRMTERLAGRQMYTYEENGAAFDFTGWTGTCIVTDKDDGTLITPTVAVNEYGTITVTWTADDASALAEYAAGRGLILPGITAETEITDETDTLLFQAAVAWEKRV